MKKILALMVFSALLFYFVCWRLPETTPVFTTALPKNSATVLLPLDSRPVCTKLPQQIGSLAGTNVILPPIGFLDNYKKPAEREKLYLWLRDNIKSADYAVIASDILINGGLINSRLALGDRAAQNNFLNTMIKLNAENRQVKFNCFSIIPRLLVSDQLLPDRWYQWHLMRYATLRDMTETFGDLELTLQQQELAQKIPPQVLDKYLSLYRANDDFNRDFVKLDYYDITTVIGQDDGSSFGMPNRNTNHARMYGSRLQNSYITYGADEIAAVLIARDYLLTREHKPEIYLQYAAPDMEFIYMPFMAASVGETIRDKVSLTGARLTEDFDASDIVMYINCGNDNFKPGKEQAQELQRLLNSGKSVALIDLAANFDKNELLMPHLLDNDVTINRLTAYAGWNTFSNSAGTALAQAIVVHGRAQELRDEAKLALYKENLQFITERLLDDYVYQKLYHADLKQDLERRGYDSSNLTPQAQHYAQTVVQQFVKRKAAELLHYNLGRTPFYTDGRKEYYLREVKADIYLPWNRIFEAGFDVTTETGVKNTEAL